jgi:glucokinase
MTDFVKPIPVLVITEPEPGLLGAARCLQRLAA